MKYILAQKIKMSQLFDEAGNAVAVTLLEAGPITVTQTKTKERDGYEAVQVGFGEKKAKRATKPELGHLKGLGPFRFVREFRVEAGELKNAGESMDVSVFEPGETVRVTGISKGKGFQGVVKRHGFHGGSRTHGQKHSEREPGSIGGGGRSGGRVVKGMRMAGRMGGDRITVKNLKVLRVDAEN